MENYLGLSRAERHFKHTGRADEEEGRAICSCKWKGLVREHRYQALADLRQHYREKSELEDEPDISNWDGVGEQQQRAWRHLL